jgi:hypothetical protein
MPKQTNNSTWIAIKHDVETNVERALQIAKIEAKFSIRATFFVQSYLLEKNKKILKSISNLGHEVTYHYDVLDANQGDFERASHEFSDTIKLFENAGFLVKSVCPHGNPMMNRNGWSSNKDFFRDPKIAALYPDIFDLVVQGKEKIAGDFCYISDAGFGFKRITDILENDQRATEDIPIESIGELISLVNNERAVVISSHPHRWVSNWLLATAVKARFNIIRRIAILVARSPLLKKIMSKFYFLAKKI